MLKAAALGIARAGGARHPHVPACTLLWLRAAAAAQPAFARDAFNFF
ncbi:MAG TPA: hypothetical protein VFP88_04900 [Rhodanobacteraceae bacterium]|nr:hypothetical protein [Rhodanobacteraceae bacterium]